MTIHRTAEALRQLGDAARLSGLTDAALLAQFAAVRDQAAFAEFWNDCSLREMSNRLDS